MSHTPNARVAAGPDFTDACRQAAIQAAHQPGHQPADQPTHQPTHQARQARPAPAALRRNKRLAALLASGLVAAGVLNALGWAFAPAHASHAKVAVTRPVSIRT